MARWRWWVTVLAYKLAEDRLLGLLNSAIDARSGTLVSALEWAIQYLPWLTWLAVPAVIIALLVVTWVDVRHERARVSGESTFPRSAVADSTSAIVEKATVPEHPLRISITERSADDPEASISLHVENSGTKS